MTIRCRSRRRITVDWQRCVGLFLEGLSLLCELHGAHVSEGRVEPLLRIPRTQRCRAECEMSYSRPIPTAGLPFPLRLHYPPLEPLREPARIPRIGQDHQLPRCPVPPRNHPIHCSQSSPCSTGSTAWRPNRPCTRRRVGRIEIDGVGIGAGGLGELLRHSVDAL